MQDCGVSTDSTEAGVALRIRQYVYFGLRSETTSAETITEVLETSPNATRVRGSRITHPPRPVTHMWALGCRDNDLDVGDQIRDVLARVRPLAPRIKTLVEAGDVSSCLTIVRFLNDEDGQPERIDTVELEDGTQLTKMGGQHQLLGWYLDPADLELLASLQSGLDVDEYN